MRIKLFLIVTLGLVQESFCQTGAGTIPDGPTIDITQRNPKDSVTFSSDSTGTGSSVVRNNPLATSSASQGSSGTVPSSSSSVRGSAGGTGLTGSLGGGTVVQDGTNPNIVSGGSGGIASQSVQDGVRGIGLPSAVQSVGGSNRVSTGTRGPMRFRPTGRTRRPRTRPTVGRGDAIQRGRLSDQLGTRTQSLRRQQQDQTAGAFDGSVLGQMMRRRIESQNRRRLRGSNPGFGLQDQQTLRRPSRRRGTQRRPIRRGGGVRRQRPAQDITSPRFTQRRTTRPRDPMSTTRRATRRQRPTSSMPRQTTSRRPSMPSVQPTQSTRFDIPTTMMPRMDFLSRDSTVSDRRSTRGTTTSTWDAPQTSRIPRQRMGSAWDFPETTQMPRRRLRRRRRQPLTQPARDFDPTRQPVSTRQSVSNIETSRQPVSTFETPRQPVGQFTPIRQPISTFEAPRQPVREFNPVRQPVSTFEAPRQPVREFNPVRQPVSNFDTVRQSVNNFDTRRQPVSTFDTMRQPIREFDTGRTRVGRDVLSTNLLTDTRDFTSQDFIDDRRRRRPDFDDSTIVQTTAMDVTASPLQDTYTVTNYPQLGGNDEPVSQDILPLQPQIERQRPVVRRPATPPPIVLPPIRARGDMRFQLPSRATFPPPVRVTTEPPIMRGDIQFEIPTTIPPPVTTQGAPVVTTAAEVPTTVSTVDYPITTDPIVETTSELPATTPTVPNEFTTIISKPTDVPTDMPGTSTVGTSDPQPPTTDVPTTILPTIFPTSPWAPDATTTQPDCTTMFVQTTPTGTTSNFFTIPQSTTDASQTTTDSDDSKETTSGQGSGGQGLPTTSATDDSRETPIDPPTGTPAGPNKQTTAPDDSSETLPDSPTGTPAGTMTPTASTDDSAENSLSPTPQIPDFTTGSATRSGDSGSDESEDSDESSDDEKDSKSTESESGESSDDDSNDDDSDDDSSDENESDSDSKDSASDSESESDSQSEDDSDSTDSAENSDGSDSEESSSSDSSDSSDSESADSGERKRKGRKDGKKRGTRKLKLNNNNVINENNALDNANNGLWDLFLGGGNDRMLNWFNNQGSDSGETGLSGGQMQILPPVSDGNDDELVPLSLSKALLEDIERDVDEMYYNTRSWLHVINDAGPLTKRAMNKLYKFDNFVDLTYRRMSEEFFSQPLFGLNNNMGLNYDNGNFGTNYDNVNTGMNFNTNYDNFNTNYDNMNTGSSYDSNIAMPIDTGLQQSPDTTVASADPTTDDSGEQLSTTDPKTVPAYDLNSGSNTLQPDSMTTNGVTYETATSPNTIGQTAMGAVTPASIQFTPNGDEGAFGLRILNQPTTNDMNIGSGQSSNGLTGVTQDTLGQTLLPVSSNSLQGMNSGDR